MIDIRWASLTDAKDLGVVHSESYRTAYKGIIPDFYLNQCTPAAREEYFYYALAHSKERIAIMFVNFEAVGVLILVTDLENNCGEISALYLKPNFRSMGLGKKLLQWGITELKTLGYSQAVLWVLKENKNAIDFYVRQGFENDGSERTIFRGRELSQMIFQKKF